MTLFGGTLGEVLVLVGVDTKPLDEGLARAKASTAEADGAISGFSTTAKVAMAVAGAAVLAFAADSIKAYSEHEDILAKLSTAIHGNTEDLQANADAMQSLTGYQHDQILSADAMLARFHLTQTQIKQLIPRVLDYANVTGQDAATAAGSFGKALLGNSRALKAIGIDYHATGNAEQDYKTLLDDLNHSTIVGTAAQDTQKKSLRELSSAWTDAKEAFGQFLAKFATPVLKDAATIFDDLVHPTHVFRVELDALTQSQADYINSTDGTHDALVKLRDMYAKVGDTIHSQLLGALIDEAAQQKTTTNSTNDLVTAQAAAAAAAKAQAAAEEALAGKLPGLIGDVIALKNAQHDLHAAQQDSSTSASELHTKELDVVNAFASVKGAFGDILSEYQNGTATIADVIDKFKKQADAAGLTKNQTNDLIGVIKSYINVLGQIPSNVNTTVSVNGGYSSGGSAPHGFPNPPPNPPPASGPNSRSQPDNINVTVTAPNVFGVSLDDLTKMIRAGVQRGKERNGGVTGF